MTGSSDQEFPLSNPFVGPRPIETGQPIFGRDREVEELYYLLSAERIVLLHSPSGAGKSSLIQAGLVPRLSQLFDVWGPTRINLPPPQDSPIGVNRYAFSAILGLEAQLPNDRQRLPAQLAPMNLSDYVASRPRRRTAAPNIVIIFDQFEEILTVEPVAIDSKQAFFDELGILLQDPHVWALFALREDYLAALDPYAQRVATHFRNRFRLELLTRNAAQSAIAKSAERGGRQFLTEAVTKLVDDLATIQVQSPDGAFQSQTGPFVEPLHLQVVCRGLWERTTTEKRTLDLDDIQAFGDVTEALATYYAMEVAEIANGDLRTERAIREWIGNVLVTPEGIRGQVLRGAGRSEGLDNQLIGQLVNAHLVRGEQRVGAFWYELAHDRLIKPVRNDNGKWFESHLSQLQKVAALWQSQGRPDGWLLLNQDLIAAKEWAAQNESMMTDAEHQFLEASEAEQASVWLKRRQTRRLKMALGIALSMLCVAAVACVIAYKSETTARIAAKTATTEAKKATDALNSLNFETLKLQQSEAKDQTDAKAANTQKMLAQKALLTAEFERQKAQANAQSAINAKNWQLVGEESSHLLVQVTEQHVELFFVNTRDRNIYELWGWVGPNPSFDGWHPNNITTANVQKPPAAPGSPLAGFYDSVAQTDAVFYAGMDHHLYEVLFLPPGRWLGIDTTASSGAPILGPDNTIAAQINPITKAEEVFFVVADGTIQEIASPSSATGDRRPRWTTTNLYAGLPVTTPHVCPGSALIITFDPRHPSIEQVNYIRADGGYYNLESATPGIWTSNQFGNPRQIPCDAAGGKARP